MSDSRPGEELPVGDDEPTLVFDDTVVQDPVEPPHTEAPPGPATSTATDPDRRQRLARGAVIGLVGAAIGFGLAVLIVAWNGNDVVDDPAAVTTIKALESDLDDREARISELEASLAEARAASDGSDQDADARSAALDERAAVLEEWSRDLSEREEDVARREAELDDRERRLAEREGETGDDGGGGPIDDEVVDGIVQRVLDRLRALFE